MVKSLNRRDFFKLSGGAAAVAGVAAIAPSALASPMSKNLSSATETMPNEWAPLKKMFVGHTNKLTLPKLDWVINNYVGTSDEIKESLKANAGKLGTDIAPDFYPIAAAQQDALAELLTQHGVEVVRPDLMDEVDRQFNPVGYHDTYPRDPVLAVDDELINLTVRSPFRRKSHITMAGPIRAQAERTGQRWTSMPVLSFNADLSDESVPMLEGGDIFVLGKDILIGHSGLASSYAGIEWLQKHLKPKGYRVHTIELTGEWLHLDCVFSTPREGLAMCCLEGVKGGVKAFPEFMHNWTWLTATKKEAKALGCNGVCLAPNKIVMDSAHTRINKMLRDYGVEVIETDFAVCSQIGGGIRCATHPLARQA
ncbi:dimethylarginine dimethylaminohydrolase family protein [Paraferrimonas sedimenticola]|uniref:Amidinotransferase n=1 Tax=Paraferrimonas sedimenticola TaxID=375674 RepID=A0AA37W217_9GAMM|nr:arginine deiminase family protein [Paraferrimonas sedimenticola]GLP97615.1 amidinotransferase [Paraferrimonas sedimenticola]